MHIGARRVIGLIQAVLNRLDDDLAGMNADADLQIRIADAFDAFLHGESSETTADGVILVRLRGAEQRHDAVALRLVDDAVVADHGLVHGIEDGLQPLHADFGIAKQVHQPGRVADISKQYRQALALAALGAQQPQRFQQGKLDGMARLQAESCSCRNSGCRRD